MNRISTVVFDFDGVLADTEGLHLRAFQEVFATRGWTLDAAAYFDRYLGYDDQGLVVAFNEDHQLGLGAVAIGDLVETKGRIFAGFLEAGDVLFPNARACVTALATRFQLGIASGALHGEIAMILEAAGLSSLFPVVVAADDVTACKPSPEPYVTAAARLGVDPASCVAIEDSQPGLQAARAAGMRTIGITTTSPRHLLTGADHVIEDLRELSPDLVLALGRGPGL